MIHRRNAAPVLTPDVTHRPKHRRPTLAQAYRAHRNARAAARKAA